MANIFSKLVSKATFWDQADDQRIAREEDEERKRRNVQAVSSNMPRVPNQGTNQFNFNQPLVKDPLNPNQPTKPSFLVGGSQSEMMLQKPKPVAMPQDTRSAKVKELDELAASELDSAREEQKKGEGFFGRMLNGKAIEERAVSQARNRATTKFQDKYGWNADPEVLAFNKGTSARLNVEGERLRKNAKSLDDFSKGMDKVGEVAGYIPITGSVLNLGLAGTEKLAKATGNDAYAEDIEDQRLRLDVGMDKEQFDQLDPETQQKLRNLQGLGLALSPLDFLGVGGLAKSGVVAAGKKGAVEFAKDGAVDFATKQALKKALIAEGKSAIVPAVVGAGASTAGQIYLGGTENFDPLEAAKTGLLTAGASKILPFQSKGASKGKFGLDDISQEADEIPVPKNIKTGGTFGLEALEKADEGIDIETPQLPGAKTAEGEGTEIAPGLKSPDDKPVVPKPTVDPYGPGMIQPLPEPNFPEIAPLAKLPEAQAKQVLKRSLADSSSSPLPITPKSGKVQAPDPLDSLKAEARKYKSAEEFTKAIQDGKVEIPKGSPETIAKLQKELGMNWDSAYKTPDGVANMQKKVIADLYNQATQSQPPKSPIESLKQEARKYKSAEEFVKAQGEPVYHRSQNKFDKFDISKVSNDSNRQRYGWGLYFSDTIPHDQYGKHLYEAQAPKGTLIDTKKPVDEKIVSKIVDAVKGNNKNPSELDEFSYNGYLFYKTLSRILGGDKEASLFLSKNGIDGLKSNIGKNTNDYILFNDKSIKTKQQLTDLYNQAKSAPIEKTPTLTPQEEIRQINKKAGASKVVDKDKSLIKNVMDDQNGFAKIPGKAKEVGQAIPEAQAKPQIPDVTNPIALAKAADETSTTTVATPQGGADEVPMADFSKAINVPLQKAPEVEAAAITPQPTQTDLAAAAQAGDLRQSTQTTAEDALGNEALQSDAAVVGELVDQGIAPTRQGSPVATSEEALQMAAAKAAEAEVDMAAPRTRAEAVNIIENESARLDAAETFKSKDVTNIAETQAAATTAIRDIDDAGLISAFRAEPEIKTPQQFFETVAAVERLGKLDPADPAQVRALTNALDGLSSFSSRAGRDLRMVKELFANLPPAMRKQYLIDRIESKLGVELPDLQRTELLGKITGADETQGKINDITGRLEEAQRNVELGAPVDEAIVMKDIDDLGKLQTVHEYQQGDAFQYSQDLLQSGTAGAKVAQATKTAMLSSPLRRTADVITTGITSASDTASNAISGVIGRALNKLPGKAGTFRETRAGDYKVLTEGNKEGFKDSLTSLRTDNRKVDDIMGELQKNTRSDANGAGRTRFGRAVGDMTEMATNTTQGQRDQRLRELARQEGQKLGLNGDDLDLYTQITEKIPNEIQKHEASQYHLRTNNLHDNKLNTAFRSVASVIEKQFPQAGPIVTALTVPFKSYQAGNLNRLFTDKTVLGNAFTLVQAAKRGDTQGVVDALGKAAVNTGETLVLGSILSSAGLLKDTNDNGEDYAGPYLQTPFGDVPVGFLGPSGLNIIVGHNLAKLSDGQDIDEMINNFGKQALSFMNVAGSLGGDTPIQEVLSGNGDVTDRITKAAGDTLRRPIPSVMSDLNAVGNTISGQDKALTKAKDEEGNTDYLKTELNRTIDKVGLGALLERDEGKTSQNILDRITGGTHSSDATTEAEGQRNIEQEIKDLEKQLKKEKVPLEEAEIEDALDAGEYDDAIKGLQFKLAKLQNDPEAKNSTVEKAQDELIQATLRKEGIPVTEDGIKARTESGDYSEAILGSRYQLQKLEGDKDVPESKKQTIRDDITRLQITAGGSYPPSVIALYSDTSQSEWRAMGNPESEDYDPETYQLLYQYDTQLKEKGVSKSSKGGDKPKFTVGKGGSGGGGRGGSNKGFTTSIALQKFEGGDGGKQKYLAADFAEPKSSIPVLQKTPNYDQSKKKKITVSKGGRS